MPTTRSRPNQRRGGPGVKRKASSLTTGAAGRKRIDGELQKAQERADRRAAQRNAPRRYWMPPGTEREVIVLDREPYAFRTEHALDNPETGRKDLFVPCIAETDDCPACHVDNRDPAFVMFLSVLDLTPWKTRKGKTVRASRRLVAVKARQQKKFTRKFDAVGNLRGLKVVLTRDDDRSPVIGNDIEFTGKRLSEAGLARYVEEWKDRKGKVHTTNLGDPFDYDELFPAMTKKEIGAVVGYTDATPGSDEEAEGTKDSLDDWDQNPEDAPWEEDEKPKTRRPKKKVRKVKSTGAASRRPAGAKRRAARRSA